MESIQKDSNTLVVALGGNLPAGAPAAGDCSPTLVAALGALAARGFGLRAVSRFFRSPAFPAGSGPDYVNACALLETTETRPEAVLAALHAVEAAHGRVRSTRWAARSLDLDLLDAGGRILPDAATHARWRDLPLADQRTQTPDRLILPHPRLADRAFVLIPLADIAPNWRHPVSGETVMQMLSTLPQAEKAAIVPI